MSISSTELLGFAAGLRYIVAQIKCVRTNVNAWMFVKVSDEEIFFHFLDKDYSIYEGDNIIHVTGVEEDKKILAIKDYNFRTKKEDVHPREFGCFFSDWDMGYGEIRAIHKTSKEEVFTALMARIGVDIVKIEKSRMEELPYGV
jgi:hypothetical protein